MDFEVFGRRLTRSSSDWACEGGKCLRLPTGFFVPAVKAQGNNPTLKCPSYDANAELSPPDRHRIARLRTASSPLDRDWNDDLRKRPSRDGLGGLVHAPVFGHGTLFHLGQEGSTSLNDRLPSVTERSLRAADDGGRR